MLELIAEEHWDEDANCWPTMGPRNTLQQHLKAMFKDLDVQQWCGILE
jgi:hypothetical protein